mmetsp:Transcript_19364/g.54366  ORF Transcript_19364/g.54366 Transcript_19364/m.54366 type:complete len:210 (-) Transcript_19364:51-680(-)
MKAFKKATGIGVTKVEPTVDEEYDSMRATYREMNTHCQAFNKALKEQKRAWQQMTDLCLKTTEAGKNAGAPGSEITGFSHQVHDAVTAWKADQIDNDQSLVEPLRDITDLMAMVKEGSTLITQRENAVKELDYQRGEYEKANTKAKDRESAIAKVRPHLEHAQTVYQSANEAAKVKMREVLSRKDQLFPLFMRAYVSANSRMAHTFPKF